MLRCGEAGGKDKSLWVDGNGTGKGKTTARLIAQAKVPQDNTVFHRGSNDSRRGLLRRNQDRSNPSRVSPELSRKRASLQVHETDIVVSGGSRRRAANDQGCGVLRKKFDCRDAPCRQHYQGKMFSVEAVVEMEGTFLRGCGHGKSSTSVNI